MSYDYSSKIPTPSNLGVSTDGSVSTTYGNIQAGMTYVGYLLTGPNLGQKWFYDTGAQCQDTASGNTVDRSVYLDNTADQPTFLGDSMQGLLPGMLAGLEDLNPIGIFDRLTENQSTCSRVTCPVGDVTQGTNPQAAYVLNGEVSDLTANYGCTEGFATQAAPAQPTQPTQADQAAPAPAIENLILLGGVMIFIFLMGR